MTESVSGPIRLAATLGVFVALGMFLLVTFIAPDDGPTLSSWRQGLALMFVFAAPAITAFLTPPHAAALGGAMIVAGSMTMVGGNTAMLMMAASGFLLLLAATTQSDHVAPDVWMRFALVTIALVVGVYLAHGTAIITGLGALAIAALIVSSGNWRSIRRTSRQEVV